MHSPLGPGETSRIDTNFQRRFIQLQGVRQKQDNTSHSSGHVFSDENASSCDGKGSLFNLQGMTIEQAGTDDQGVLQKQDNISLCSGYAIFPTKMLHPVMERVHFLIYRG